MKKNYLGIVLTVVVISLSIAANKLVQQRTVSQQRAYETVTASDGTDCAKITVGWPKKADGDGYTIFRNSASTVNAVYCGRITNPNQTEIIDDGTLSCKGLQKTVRYHYVIYWVSPRTGNNNALGENTGYLAETCPSPSASPTPTPTIDPTITGTLTPIKI